MFKAPEKYRVTKHRNLSLCSNKSFGNNGVFLIKSLKLKVPINCIISDGYGWEHVSVSTPTRTPTWEEMCFIKGLFWDDEDYVIQTHPPKSEWINNHPFCLHLWRPIDQCMPKPPSMMVGYKELNSKVNTTK